MQVEIAWLLLVGVLAAIATVAGLLLRGVTRRARLVGAVGVGAATAVLWFWSAHDVLFRPTATTTALGVSVSLNIALVADLVATKVPRRRRTENRSDGR